MERNLLAKKFIQKIIYSKQSIEIALFYPVRNSVFNRIYAENPKDFQKLSCKNKTALLSQGGAEFFSETRASSRFKGLEMITSPIASVKEQFVSVSTSARIKKNQTFNIILPNLIHKSRRRNLNR